MYWDKKKHDQFEVTVKALIFDEQRNLLFAKDEDGKWDLPGGRISSSETIEQCLKREVMEELGVEVNKISPQPTVAELLDFDDNKKRLLVAVEVEVDSRVFKPSEENVENAYMSKEEFTRLNHAYQGLVSIADKLFAK